MRRVRLPWAAVLLAALSPACSDSVEPGLPPAVEPPVIEMIMGDGQAGTAGEALEVPLVVRVTDHWDHGVADAEVIFRIESGDGVFHDSRDSLDPCSPLFRAVSVSTTADGYAGTSLTPLSVGPVTVATRVSSHLDQPPLVFTAEASSAGWVLSKVSGDHQDAVETYEQLRESFVVELTTDEGEPVSGVAVVWEVTSGAGRLNASCDLDTIPATLTFRTLDDGTTGQPHNGVLFRPGVYGISTVSASVTGAQGSPVTFTAEATLQVIWLGNPYIGPGFDPEVVAVPVGATVEWRNASQSARIVSTSVPPGGTAFDSGPLVENGSFQFVPDAPGTWRYEDEVSGAQGTLTVS